LIITSAAPSETEVPRVEQNEETEQAPTSTQEPSARPDRAEPAVIAHEATIVITRILELMGEKAEIEVIDDSSAENVELNIKGDGSGLLIGRHGQTLDALEYVVNRILARKLKDAATPVSIDTESYRARRRRQLHRMALAKGEQAKREHLAVALDPMPPRDRRIIHLALKDDPMVTTRSSGDGFLRSVEITPVEERREGSGTKGRDWNRDRSRESGRDQERTPPGQQGGFKHGQKRIV
jgi:spoIIIJ-associated protein